MSGTKFVNGVEVDLDSDDLAQRELDIAGAAPQRPAALAAARYAAEIAGINWNGWPVDTRRGDSRANLNAEFSAAQSGARADGEVWKFADGDFRPLTNAQAIEMALAVRSHVKDCYATEAAKLADDSDPATGWPT